MRKDRTMPLHGGRGTVRIPQSLRIDPAIRRQMRAAREDFWRREMLYSRRSFWMRTLSTIAFIVAVFCASYLIVGGRF